MDLESKGDEFMSILETKNLSKIYGGKTGVQVKALNNLNIDIREGEFVGIMGPSGSGKSTLLNIMATIDKPSAGHVLIAGKDPHLMNQDQLAVFRRKNLGFIFQDFNLLDTLSIKENIILPLVIDGEKPKIIDEKLERVAKVLGIYEILDKRTYEVSGGQQQRAAAARAIIGEPKIILADEPTGNLDSKSSYDLMSSLEKLNKENGATIVMVTHDAFAASFTERIVMIKDGEEFLEINKKEDNRQVFFNQILESLSMLGGGYNETI